MRIGRWIVAASCAVLLPAGCGGGDEDAETVPRRPPPVREVRLTLEGKAGPENVAVLMAESMGFFADVGLRAVIANPIRPWRPVPYVAEGTDDLGLAQQPQVVLAKGKGAPVIAVGGLVSQPTTAMIWLARSKIRDLADLEGKTIAVPGVQFQKELLRSMLAGAGLTLADVEVKTVGYELVPALLGGRADAIFGGSWNVEGIELESRGAKPVVTRVQDLNVPAYENLVVVARTDLVAEDPRLVRDFMQAVARGAEATIEDPEAAVDAIQQSVAANPETSRAATEAQVRATLPLLSESGSMDPDQAGDLVEWMYDQGMIRQQVPVSELLSNDYR